jgi:hypothetical protein
MSANVSTDSSLIRQAVVQVASLPEEDLSLVIEFVDYLKQRHKSPAERRLAAAEMRAEARRRASALQGVPRHQLVARFKELTEAIRSEAVAKGTAIEGDWQRD